MINKESDVHRIEMTDIDQRIARVCDPRTYRRYEVLWHNPNTSERWLVAIVPPGDMARFKEALKGQGCQLVVYQQERTEWNLVQWLRVYMKEAPIQQIAMSLEAIRGTHFPDPFAH